MYYIISQYYTRGTQFGGTQVQGLVTLQKQGRLFFTSDKEVRELKPDRNI